jgi:dinuclear metal center YbgI/SA1388 family protein
MKFKELIDYLDEQFPGNLSMPGDNDGVDVCVDYDLEVGRILIVLDITFEIINYAITHGYNCIISHHAMISQPLQKLDLSNAACKKAVMLIRHDICAAAFHTRLDSVTGGVCDCLINAAGIAGSIEPLYCGGIPIGRIVTLPEETSLRSFSGDITKSMRKFYKTEFSVSADFNISYAGGEKKVRKIGIAGGSGMSCAKPAAEAGADTFFTGEGKYHDILDAYEFLGMNVITAGHFETEAVVLPFIKQKILEKFPDANADCFIGQYDV